MRIVNPIALASLAGIAASAAAPPSGPQAPLRQRLNAYTLWAFNPQRELTSRYDRAA